MIITVTKTQILQMFSYLVNNSRSQFIMREVKSDIHEPKGRLACCCPIITHYCYYCSITHTRWVLDPGTEFTPKKCGRNMEDVAC